MAWIRGYCPMGCGKEVSLTADGLRAPRHRCSTKPPRMEKRPKWICYRGLHTSRAAKEPRKCAKCSDTVYPFQYWLDGKHKPPKTEEEKARDRVKLEEAKAKIMRSLRGDGR